MGREDKGRKTRFLDRDAELFFHFPNDRLFGTLARLDLAAGKFPQPRQRFSFGALGNQNASIFVDQRAGSDKDDTESGHCGSSIA